MYWVRESYNKHGCYNEIQMLAHAALSSGTIKHTMHQSYIQVVTRIISVVLARALCYSHLFRSRLQIFARIVKENSFLVFLAQNVTNSVLDFVMNASITFAIISNINCFCMLKHYVGSHFRIFLKVTFLGQLVRQ